MGSIIFPRTTELPTIETGAITVEVTPPTDVQLVNVENSTVNNFTIAAGKIRVLIENRIGETSGNITVNGGTIAPGAAFESEVKWDGVNRYLLPAFNVVTNGVLVFYSYDEEA